jgi:pyridoxal phosphate enzyme (YggS family)
MGPVIINYEKIKNLVNNTNINIIAVSKSFTYDHIEPLVRYGHKHFGENKVQEAQNKWLKIKEKIPDLNLHMIGKLQSNKAKDAIKLFEYIHSVDNPKLASLLSKYESLLKKNRKYFIQVNLGNEKQKNGVYEKDLDAFYTFCSKELNLNILGLMAIPPNDGNENAYFRKLMELNLSLGLKELSMGMSNDFQEALKFKTTFIRIGSAIFGNRF